MSEVKTENKIEFAIVPEKEYKIVSEASVARKLLKDGYRVVDIKPKRGHESESIFVFAVVPGFMDRLAMYMDERKEKKRKKPD